MRVIECPFCNGGLPTFCIGNDGCFHKVWLECPKCHNRTKKINFTGYLNMNHPDVCMKDRKRLGRMWNGWQFVGVSEKVAERR